jgi:hypothetical protein
MKFLSFFTRRPDGRAEPVEAIPDAVRIALIEADIEAGIERQRIKRLTRNSPQYRAADTRAARGRG